MNQVSFNFQSKNVENILKIGGCMAVSFLSYKYISKWYHNLEDKRYLDKIRSKRQREREAEFSLVRANCQSTLKERSKHKEIISLSLPQLQKKLSERELSSVDVLRAFIWKSMLVQDEFNCITEFIPEAIEKAHELDAMDGVRGPLHGLPFCVKEDTAIASYDCSMGCTRRLYRPEEETAVIVQCLEKLGAIAFCRTNLPQTCISFGSCNPIFGKTVNPLNTRVGPGGSSSGTGCLIAAGGAPFGTGSDTGGSLRSPAHFCGLSTLKPTSSRISRRGCTKCCDMLPGVPGILTKTAQDQVIVFQALMDNFLQNTMDPYTVPITWNNLMFKSHDKLRIGYFNGLPMFPPVGDSQNVVSKAKSFLESKGHIVVPFDLPVDVGSTFLKLPFDSNIKQRFHDLLHNDEIADCIKNEVDACNRAYDGSGIMPRGKSSTVLPTREELVHIFLDKMNQAEIDVIICPVLPFPAVQDVQVYPGIVGYTIMWNLLDFPAGVVKVSQESGIEWKTSVEKMNVSHETKRNLLNTMSASVGMPIGVQVVAKPFQEEIVLKVMLELDEINNH